MIAFSVIIPVFDTECSLLRQCIDSVIVHESLEVLIINDGSGKEETVRVCKEYAMCYPQIRYFEQENSGPGASRNMGIEKANGEYIIFLDSDDWWSGDFLEQSIDIIKNLSPDVLICGAQKVEFETGETEYIGIADGAMEYWDCGADALKALLTQDIRYEWYAWKYLIKREFLQKQDLRFVKGIFYEDVEFVPRMLFAAGKVVSVPETFVNYRFHNPMSILNTPNVQKSNDKVKVVELLIHFANHHFHTETLALFMQNLSQLFLSAYGDAINGVAIESETLRRNISILRYNESRFGKTVYFFTKVFGFKNGTKIVKMLKKGMLK